MAAAVLLGGASGGSVAAAVWACRAPAHDDRGRGGRGLCRWRKRLWGLFITRAVCATLPLMIVAGRVGDTTGLCPVVAAVAGVAVPGLWGGGLADGLDGGGGVLMAAAGFAHDAFLLRDPALRDPG